MRWWFFRVFLPSLKTLARFVCFEVTKVTPMKWPLQLHRKTRRQAACCGWNGAVGFNVAQFCLVFLARRKYGTSRGERNGGEFLLNLWWFFVCKDFGGLGLPLDFQRPFSISGRMAKIVHPPPKLLKMRSARPIFMTDVAWTYALQMLFGHTYSMCKC